VTFTVTLVDNGPAAATNVAVTDMLPAGFTFVSATLSQGAYVTNTGVWTVGSVANGASATLQIKATVDSGTASTNTATISASDQFDPDSGNNSAGAIVQPD
jgi:uncharacterized repeat protein (TIGR01451 family)